MVLRLASGLGRVSKRTTDSVASFSRRAVEKMTENPVVNVRILPEKGRIPQKKKVGFPKKRVGFPPKKGMIPKKKG